MRINLTQHKATPEQECSEPRDKARVCQLLTFDAIPSNGDIINRARELAKIASEHGASEAMIGGAPFFMTALEEYLCSIGIKPLFAFSVRASAEEIQADGSLKKVAVFKHIGFVPSILWE